MQDKYYNRYYFSWHFLLHIVNVKEKIDKKKIEKDYKILMKMKDPGYTITLELNK